MRSRTWLISLLMTLVPLTALAAPSGPPPTEKHPVTDTIHGVKITDDYRWLEGDDSDPNNMGAMTDQVKAWTDAQNAYTRSVLDNLPGRDKVEARLRQLMEIGYVSAPVMRVNRYFYTKREGDQAQPIVYMRQRYDGTPRVLIDPNTLDPDGLVTVDWIEPNHDGTLLAFGMYRAGDENATLYVLNVDTGKWLADQIPGRVTSVSWMPDSSGFFYRRLADVKNPYSGQIKYHRLGTNQREDPVLFEQYKEGEGSKTWGPWAGCSRDGRWMIVGYSMGWSRNDLWVVDLDRWFRTGEFKRVPIVVGKEAISEGEINGDTLLLKTNLDAPNGQIFAVDLNKPDREHWKQIVPERKDAVLQSISLARGMFTATYLHNACSQIEMFELDGTPLGELELPGIGTASVSTQDDRTEAFLTFTSFNEPRSIYRVDLKTGERWLWDRPEVPVDPSTVEVKQVWYSSKDGTRISMFVVHKKGLKLDGDNPTILTGYGGFDISMTPYFSATLFQWYDAGGVFALPNLRGGGEYGKAWHEAGVQQNKQNVFDDFIAAAEWLISNGYTKPERLAISGGSNGGLLIGAAITQRPDLYSAAVCAVPLLDMLRFQDFLMARYWVSEYGSSEDPDQFKYLLKYSPYQHVKPGVKYPAVLFTAGENDARVHPMHARKMTALMQADTASDPAKKPILLWVERDAGHGGGKPLDLRVRDLADQRIFIMWQLGMLDSSADKDK